MKALIVSEWLTLDDVFDADTMNQWFEPFESPERNAYIEENVRVADALLLGRTTYEMFLAYWPKQKDNAYGIADKMNSMPKHVASRTLTSASWNATVIKNNLVERVAELKKQPGHELHLYGSASLVPMLARAGLVDEYRFLVQPVTMGKGKRFFGEGWDPMRLKLVKHKTLEKGVMLLCYQPAAR